MSRYLVTGGAGFIGSHLAERLLLDGHAVRILDNLSTGRKENLAYLQGLRGRGTLEWIEGDIRSLDTCRNACAGVEYVLHQAALASVSRSILNPADTTTVNVTGLVHVLAAARETGVRRVICASSSSVYGDTAVLPKDEGMTPVPLSPYAASKLAGEHFAHVFAVTMALETVSLRYFNVFGPRQDPDSDYAAVIPRFVTALLKGRRPRLFGDGTQSRDFTYVENVVQANFDACTRGPGGGEVLNVACGERYTLLELLQALAEITGARPDLEILERRPGDVLHSQASIARARTVIGFHPRIGFREGLSRTVDWYRSGRERA